MRNCFLLTKEENQLFNNSIKIGDFYLYYNDFKVFSDKSNNSQIVLLGNFVDSHNPARSQKEIINELIELSSFNEIINKSKKLAGRFIIFHYNQLKLHILPDATASIQVSYSTKSEVLFASSHPKIIANKMNENISEQALDIQMKSEQNLIMPYDRTVYDNIRYVIPNHYLEFINQTSVRYYPLKIESNVSIEKAVHITSHQVKSILKGYNNLFGKLSLPLTAGVDSRTILASSREIIKDITTYTFMHKNFDCNTADIVIPKLISEKLEFKHLVINDLALPDSVLSIQKGFLEYEINISELRNSWTYKNSQLKNLLRLDGNISPLAKSSFGKNLPESWATVFYLSTKTHNHSAVNKRIIKEWSNDIEPYLKKSNKSKYDMFFWEHRIGKWTSNSLKNFDTLGDSINPFNCREVIENWLNVPRKIRSNNSLHELVIKENWPELLDYPINPNQKYTFLNRFQSLFYFASITKFLLNKFKHRF